MKKYLDRTCLWGDIFAKAIDGGHHSSPLGLADIVYEGMAWSVKTVKAKKPLIARDIRLISGRNDIGDSFDIRDAFDDLTVTGNKVLEIWNERVNIAKDSYEPLRTCVLIRNFNALEFTIFEYETTRFDPQGFAWRLNKNNNLQGYDKATGKHKFTWQTGGRQFTIKCSVPASARRFKLRRPSIEFEAIIERLNFDPSWVTIL